MGSEMCIRDSENPRQADQPEPQQGPEPAPEQPPEDGNRWQEGARARERHPRPEPARDQSPDGGYPDFKEAERGFGQHWGQGDAREGRHEPQPDSTSDDYDGFYDTHRDRNKQREPEDKRGRPKRRTTKDYFFQGDAAGQWQARTPGQARRPASPPTSPEEVRRTPAPEPNPWTAGTGAGLRQQEVCLLYTSPSPRDS